MPSLCLTQCLHRIRTRRLTVSLKSFALLGPRSLPPVFPLPRIHRDRAAPGSSGALGRRGTQHSTHSPSTHIPGGPWRPHLVLGSGPRRPPCGPRLRPSRSRLCAASFTPAGCSVTVTRALSQIAICLRGPVGLRLSFRPGFLVSENRVLRVPTSAGGPQSRVWRLQPRAGLWASLRVSLARRGVWPALPSCVLPRLGQFLGFFCSAVRLSVE